MAPPDGIPYYPVFIHLADGDVLTCVSYAAPGFIEYGAFQLDVVADACYHDEIFHGDFQ